MIEPDTDGRRVRPSPRRSRSRTAGPRFEDSPFLEDPATGIVLIVMGCLALAVELKSENPSAGGPLLFLFLCGAGGYVLARAISAARRAPPVDRSAAPGARRHAESSLDRRQWAAVKKEGMLLAGFCSYVLYFFPHWAPFTLPKLLLALGLLFGTAITLGIGRGQEEEPHRRRRDGYTPGERTARTRRAWPRYRGFVAMVTGVVLVCVGTWQGWRTDSIQGGSSLLSYLCWLVSLMFGISFFLLGLRHLRMGALGALFASLAAILTGLGACKGANRPYALPLDPDFLDRPTSSVVAWIFVGALVGIWAVHVLLRVYGPWRLARARMSDYAAPFE